MVGKTISSVLISYKIHIVKQAMIKSLHYTVHRSVIKVWGPLYVEMTTVSWILIRASARAPHDIDWDVRADVLTWWIILPDSDKLVVSN